MTTNCDSDEKERVHQLLKLVEGMEQEAVESSELWPAIQLLEAMGEIDDNWRRYKKALELLRDTAIVESPKLKEYMLADDAYQTAWNRVYGNAHKIEVA